MSIESLESGKRVYLNITIKVPEDSKDYLFDEIILNVNDREWTLPIEFTITEDKEEVELEGTSITEKLSCLDFGKICGYSEECNGETTASLEGSCCLGKCVPEGKKGSAGWIIGIILILIAIGAGIYFFIEAKKKQKPKSTEQILKEKSQKFDKRMENSSKEVRGKLDTI